MRERAGATAAELLDEDARVAVDEPLNQEDLSPLGHAIAADLTVGKGLAADAPCRRIQPHRFPDDPFGVAEIGNIAGGGGSIAQDVV